MAAQTEDKKKQNLQRQEAQKLADLKQKDLKAEQHALLTNTSKGISLYIYIYLLIC